MGQVQGRQIVAILAILQGAEGYLQAGVGQGSGFEPDARGLHAANRFLQARFVVDVFGGCGQQVQMHRIVRGGRVLEPHEGGFARVPVQLEYLIRLGQQCIQLSDAVGIRGRCTGYGIDLRLHEFDRLDRILVNHQFERLQGRIRDIQAGRMRKKRRQRRDHRQCDTG